MEPNVIESMNASKMEREMKRDQREMRKIKE